MVNGTPNMVVCLCVLSKNSKSLRSNYSSILTCCIHAKKKCLTFVMKTFERISLNHKNECEIGDARSKYVCLNKWLKVNATFFLWNNVLFFCWEFIVFGRIYTWNIYLFSCDCSHFINFMLKTMFSLWSILFGRFTIYFSYTFLVLRIQKWTRRTRNVKFN